MAGSKPPAEAPALRLFDRSRDLREAVFHDRPNRFVVRASLGKRIVEAHCPNPGRLREILLPGTVLLLERRRGLSGTQGKRRLEYSLVAAKHRGLLIPLVSARANDLAQTVVLPAIFPRLREMRREVPVGKSRLDFVLSFDPQGQSSAVSPEDSQKLYLEVKACTLIAEQTAMFPDAPTLRGLKHLEELEALAAEAPGQSEGAGSRQVPGSGVLFVLMNPDARRFVPNLHTDPAFTCKLISLKDRIWMRAVSIRTEEDGTARLANPDVPIDLGAASAVVDDRGVYLLVLELKRRCRFPVGTLGEIQFEAVWYVYVGSGKKNLSPRIARHHRRRKKMHWHIDYLLARVDPGDVTSLAIRSEHDLECRLARDVAGIAAASTNGFGCSDCSCRSHLFRFDNNPLHSRGFLDLLLHYRHSAALT